MVRREPRRLAGLPPSRPAGAPARHLPDRSHAPHGFRRGRGPRLRGGPLRRAPEQPLGHRRPGASGGRCGATPLHPDLGSGPQGRRTRARGGVFLRSGPRSQQCQRAPGPSARDVDRLRLRRRGLRDRPWPDGGPAPRPVDGGDGGRPRQPAQSRDRCRRVAGRPPAGAGRPRPDPGLLGGRALGVRRRRRAATRPDHPGRPGRDRGQGGRSPGRRARALGDRGRGRRPVGGRCGRGPSRDGQRTHAAGGRGEGGAAGRGPPTPGRGGRRAEARPGQRAGGGRRPAPRRGGRPPRPGGGARRPRVARDARDAPDGDRAGPERGARAARRHPSPVPGEWRPAGRTRGAR